jgi:shikimate dehydrogenase
MNITAATKTYAIIGDPVEHSLSPIMQNGWIADYGFDAVYVALPLKSANAVAALRALKQLGLAGANVTVPHKEAAARAADKSEGSVANVLRWEADGALSAFNTDGPGFLESLDEAAPAWRGRSTRALIVGAGGGAQGIAQALSPHVATVHIVNRTPERADMVAKSIANGRMLRWNDLERGFGAADLIVQTTTLGFEGADSPEWPLAVCKPTTIVADIVYRPLETPFLAVARQRGLIAVDGLGMLVHQGVRSFELWFGVKPSAARARARLMQALQP